MDKSTSASIGFGQFEVAFGEREGNLSHMERLAREAPGARLLVFPELATSGYDFIDAAEVAQLAEPFGEAPTSEWARRVSAETGAILVLGYPEMDGDKLYNSAMLCTPEGALHNYRKLHLFSRENELFSPGDARAPVVETGIGRIGMMICFDWFFPEVARSLALAGADIIAHPSNLVLPWCQRAMFARSVENGVFTVTANRTGTENRAGRCLTFTGGSQMLDPKGEVLAQAGPDEECVRLAEVDVARARDKRLNAYNDLVGSRRPEFYGALTEGEG